jgi:hypothetical protein
MLTPYWVPGQAWPRFGSVLKCVAPQSVKSGSALKLPPTQQGARLRRLRGFVTNEGNYRRLLLTSCRRVALAIWLQLRSFPSRIVFLRSKRLDQGLAYGPLFDPLQQSDVLDKRTHARILDTQSLKENMKWMTPLECWVFLEGWTRGEEYGRNDIPQKENQGNQQVLPR